MKTHKDFDERVWATIATIIISTIIIFIILQLFSDKTVSLVKDLLGIASTVFAAFIAIYIFKGWLIQKRLEILSEQSKNYLLEFPNLYLDMLSFFTSVADFLHRLELYKEHKNPNLLLSIEQLSIDLYKHKFLFVIVNGNNFNNELRELMPNKDLKILNEILDDMQILRKYIFEKNIFDVQHRENQDLKTITHNLESLKGNMFKNFELFHKQLMDYKNYNI